MKIQEIYKAKKVEEVLGLLDQYQSGCKLIAGGTDIIIDLKNNKVEPKILVDISSIEEIASVKEEGEWIEIGSGTTFTDIVNSELLGGSLKALREAARYIGSPQIRNRGTVGGNICNGSTAADMVPPLMVLDAILIFRSLEGERKVPLEDFYWGQQDLDLKDNELLYKILFKKNKKNQFLGFNKLGLRKALAISRIATAVFLEMDEEGICKEIRISNGSVGRYVLREKEVEKAWKNKKLNEALIEEGARALEVQVQKRLEGRHSLPFKKEAVKGTFKKAIENAMGARV